MSGNQFIVITARHGQNSPIDGIHNVDANAAAWAQRRNIAKLNRICLALATDIE